MAIVVTDHAETSVLSRRHFLSKSAGSLGGMALFSLLARSGFAEDFNPFIQDSPRETFIDRWLASKEAAEIRKDIKKHVQFLDVDDPKTRETATFGLYKAINRLRLCAGSIPADFRKLYTFPDDQVSTEKKMRLEIINAIFENNLQATGLPTCETNIAEVLRNLKIISGVEITFEDRYSSELEYIAYTINPGSQRFSDILTDICEITRTFPVCRGHNKVSLLRQSLSNPLQVIPLEIGVGVLSEQDYGRSIFSFIADPNLAIAELGNANLYGFGSKECVIRIPPCEGTAWEFMQQHGCFYPRTKSIVGSRDQKDLPISERVVELDAWVAFEPSSHIIDLCTRSRLVCGFHNITFQNTSSSEYELLIGTEIEGESDYRRNQILQSATMATDIEFLDRKGKPIKYLRRPAKVDDNFKVSWQEVSCDRKPVFAEIRSYREVSHLNLAIPLNGKRIRQDFCETQIDSI